MEFIVGESEMSHEPEYFSRRQVAISHHIMYFRTPFSYELNNTVIEGSAGDMLITTPGVIYRVGPARGMKEGYTNDWAFIEGLDSVIYKFPLPLNTPFSVSRHDYLRDCIIELKREKANRFNGYKLKTDCLITQMIIDVHRAYTREHNKDKPYNKLLDVRRAIRTNLTFDWTLEEMASLGGYSKSRFSNLYKDYFGLSPIDDLVKMRISHAKKILLSPYTSISEVAEACGFHTLYYFSRQFKKTEGISPSEYAKKHR